GLSATTREILAEFGACRHESTIRGYSWLLRNLIIPLGSRWLITLPGASIIHLTVSGHAITHCGVALIQPLWIERRSSLASTA
ncbi:hypothetical protein, partial [Pseudomonas aeruginosa]|uniref:hypothetical protein n=1 Tax=Pseudomonas aeruginosa TaxID=287 RepID=UPI0031B685DA